MKDNTFSVVEQYLQGLGISEHAGKEAGQCSGGTRRKLSFAMAMVGGGCVVLMDEPSAGLDPQSKRSLWDTILASFQVIIKIFLFILFCFSCYYLKNLLILKNWLKKHMLPII